MEIEPDKIHWLDKTHPNYERWKRAREISAERGKFVKSVLNLIINCKGLHILDLGSGEGGTSKILSEENNVISLDISKLRLSSQITPDSKLNLICGSSSFLPFKKNSFDVIILQDVLEHLKDRNELVDNLYNLLNKDGIIYLSTPNKFSLLNIIADPHWGMPLISLMKREGINKYFLKHFRRSETGRNDIAELFSIESLVKLFSKKFEMKLFTKKAVRELFEGNKGIAWSKFHLWLVKFSRQLKLDRIILNFSNDNYGLINKYFTPTLYFILKKRIN